MDSVSKKCLILTANSLRKQAEENKQTWLLLKQSDKYAGALDRASKLEWLANAGLGVAEKRAYVKQHNLY